jgi:hypothetical protein
MADDFDKSTVARAGRIGDHHSIAGLFGSTHSA